VADDTCPEVPISPTELRTFLIADVRGHTRLPRSRGGGEAASELAAWFAESSGRRLRVWRRAAGASRRRGPVRVRFGATGVAGGGGASKAAASDPYRHAVPSSRREVRTQVEPARLPTRLGGPHAYWARSTTWLRLSRVPPLRSIGCGGSTPDGRRGFEVQSVIRPRRPDRRRALEKSLESRSASKWACRASPIYVIPMVYG
jgi:hypothetical protein